MSEVSYTGQSESVLTNAWASESSSHSSIRVNLGNKINLIRNDTNSLYFRLQNCIFKRFFDDQVKSDDLLSKLIRLTIHFSQIHRYSTVDLPDSVVFIGGYSTENIMAKFNENGWSRLPDLKLGRYDHGSIQIDSKTFVIGGWTADIPPYNIE